MAVVPQAAINPKTRFMVRQSVIEAANAQGKVSRFLRAKSGLTARPTRLSFVNSFASIEKFDDSRSLKRGFYRS